MFPQGSSFTTRPQLAGTFGMVASTHWLASATGLAVLEKGGTAFDAAVATGLVLQVVEPHLNGPGGEVPVIGYDAAQDEVFVLDGQGPAPQGATLAAFHALGLDLLPGDGLLAPCVPAAFGTWMLLLQRYGRLGLRDVMQYAIGYARDGYPMLPGASAGIASVAGLFRDHWPTSAEIYLADGVPRQQRSEEHTSELQSPVHLVCRLLLEKKKNYNCARFKIKNYNNCFCRSARSVNAVPCSFKRRSTISCCFFFFFNDTATTEIYTLSLHDALPICTNLASHFFDLVIGKILTSRLSLSKHLAHNLGNLLLLGKIGVFHNRRNASSRLLLLISKHLILHLGNLFLIVQLHFSKLFLILKSGVNHTSRGSISTSTLPSIKLRKCSSKIITSILSFISGRLATKSNQIKQLIRNGRSASLQRTFKKSFTSFSHSTRNKTRDGLISVRNIRALNGRFNTSITHAYSIVIGSKHITLNATGGGFLTASKQFRHGATSKSRSNTASNSTKHKSPHLSGWRQIISLIT